MRPPLFLWACVLLLSGSPACAPRAAGPPPAADDAGLLPSLQATTFEDSVVLVLQVTNTGGDAVPLEFSSGQTFDFTVRQGEREVWRWSADRMFTQAVRRLTLAPGDTEMFRAVWVPPAGAHGEFTVVGEMATRAPRVAQSALITLP